MSTHEPFRFESQWSEAAGSFVRRVGVSCCKCGKDEWAHADRPGVGNRIFHNRGWVLGSKRTRDVCPSCRGDGSRRDGMTKAQKVKAWKAIDRRLGVQKEDLGGPINTVLAEKLAPIKEAMVKQGFEKVWPTRTAAGGEACSQMRRPSNGGISNPLANIHYHTFKVGDGWGWMKLEKPLDCVEGFSLERAARHSAMATRNARSKLFGEQVGTEIYACPDGTWGWRITERSIEEKESAVSTSNGASSSTAVATRTDNRAIMDELETVYDVEGQRYRGSMSDAAVSEKLKMPRIWVRQVREQFYGAYDRNETKEKEVQSLRETEAMARGSVEKLTAMALEAEQIANNLKSKLLKLGV